MSVWTDAQAERERAHAKHGDKSMESAPWTSEKRLRILLEEVGEVAREFNEADIHDREPDRGALYSELIQVVAMAGAWADAIPRPAATPRGTVLNPGVHFPFIDDGVTYCGLAGDSGIIGGCGHAWPCPDVQDEAVRRG